MTLLEIGERKRMLSSFQYDIEWETYIKARWRKVQARTALNEENKYIPL